MTLIHELTPDIVNKIAAGEVIERPAYVVKELMDNALDADANYIYIELIDGGYDTIVVADNGQGMDHEDMLLSFKAHTTSKIRDSMDLHHVKTHGFRGEALASIASVSEMEIKSRTQKEDTGNLLQIKTGVLQKDHKTGMNTGTTISVKHLFYNTPARKRFLKSPSTELRHCIDIIKAYAMAYEHVRIVCSHNQKIIMDLPSTNKRERLSALLQTTIDNQMVPVHIEEPYVEITGYISKPQYSHHHRKEQYIFVNNRFIKNSIILDSIRKAYGTLLPSTLAPSFILFLTVPYEHVDVNIHPKKDEVTFADNRIIADAVFQAVSNSLKDNNLTFQDIRWQKKSQHTKRLKDQLYVRRSDTDSDLAHILRDSISQKNIPVTHPVIQIHETYLITQTPKGLIMIDQHAAHERILFEKLIKTYKSINMKEHVTQLQHPIPIHLDHSLRLVLDDNLDTLTQEGFIFDISPDSVFLTSFPSLFNHLDIEDYVLEQLASLSGNEIGNHNDTIERMITFIACRSAYKAGDMLTQAQCHELIDELNETENSSTCPHGRPTTIHFDLKDYNRLFKRS
jgi:DNA mismatch repair protein MutL